MWLKKIVMEIVEKHNTNDPFEIAANSNIHIIEWDLHEDIRGYYKYDRRNQYIVLNSNLNNSEKKHTCSHELGHAILHPRVNTPFMRQNTFLSIDKIEREANRFSAELLIPDDIFKVSNNIYEIASLLQVPVELVKLKREKLF